MFNESDSFYYSPHGDLTNSVQRCHSRQSTPPEGEEGADIKPWQRADDRFFWNRHMLQDLISSSVCNLYNNCYAKHNYIPAVFITSRLNLKTTTISFGFQTAEEAFCNCFAQDC